MGRIFTLERSVLVVGLMLFCSLSSGVLGDDEDDEPPKTCSGHLFLCPGTTQCITDKWLCDGDPDCPDGSDENQNCAPHTCQPGKFNCKDGKLCIPKGWRCDHEEDCLDGSDESTEICSHQEMLCPPTKFLCAESRLCIELGELCDGKHDCSATNSSDEADFCTNLRVCANVTCPANSECRPAPDGHRCVCTQGFHYNGTGCIDLNECDHDGFCDQTCKNTNGSYLCSCYNTYKKVDNHCLAINDPPNEPTYVLFANSYEIRRVLEDGQDETLPFVINSGLVTAMDYDFTNQTVYYVSQPIEKEGKQLLNCHSLRDHTNWTLELTYDLRGINGMAWDWINRNWYFTDEEHERIIMCAFHSLHCVTILSTELKGLKAITVDPQAGYLFFSVFGHSPKIERTHLTGSNRMLIEASDKQIVQPHSLLVDIVNEHLYWADAYLDRLERVDYKGTLRKMIIKKKWVEDVFALALIDNNIYITSRRNSSVYRINRFDDDRSERRIIRENATNPSFIRVIHRQVQPLTGDSACITKNCDHVCTMVKTGGSSGHALEPKCLCAAGFKPLTNDSNKCIDALESKFLLYSSATVGEVKGISLTPGDRPLEVMKPIGGLSRPVAVDFHGEEQFIYYSDAQKQRIGRRKVDGTQRDDNFISTGIKNCEGIAIDWMGRNIFWTDETQKSISVAKMDNTSIQRVIISVNMAHPRAIVVDPRKDKGWIYWTDWVQNQNEGAKIERAFMDGRNRTAIITSGILWVNGLSIDYKSNTLYWCDAYYDRIESLQLDCSGTSCHKRVVTGDNVDHPYGLVHLFDGNNLVLYWTEFTDGHIKTYSNSTGKPVFQVLQQDSVPIFEIRLYDQQLQRSLGTNECTNNEKNCSELCLNTPEGPVCGCRDTYILDADGRSCRYDVNHTKIEECSENMFKCDNGHCINRRWLCDGDDDCGDNSDESRSPRNGNMSEGQCANHTCQNPDVMHMCSNNRCIYKQWLCDGENDCPNGEDEVKANCNNSDCGQNMTRCPLSKRCIPRSWLCDHDYDCNNGYDERNCDNGTCRMDQFTCKNNHCISLEYRCDGENDCRDNSDEENCWPCNNVTDFQCVSDKLCINREWRCDGEKQCKDGSDEANCTLGECSMADFTCRNGHCVYVYLQCDGDDDCGDNSDEENCHVNMTCPDTESTYKCPNETRCIPNRWKCDGENDCRDNSDEFGCESQVPCESPSRLCPNDSKRCLSVNQLCNGEPDCIDGSDEGRLCFLKICSSGGTNCDHTCADTPDGSGYVCLCPPGKRLAQDNHTCVYKEPCQEWGICSQGCKKNHYSYLCYCNDGYLLDEDHFTCVPNDTVPTYIIFSNRHEIRRLDVNTQTYTSLVSGLRNTIALDFYYDKNHEGEQSQIFWTDVVDDKIYTGTVISNSVSKITAIIDNGLATTEGLAVDWVAKKIYWVESNLDQIEVANFDGSSRATLVAGNMVSPRAIVVDPRFGKLFWSDWESQLPRIEMCSMAGEHRQIIFNVSSIVGAGWPNGLTADYDANRLYWIDARSDSIHSIDYDGKDHHEILRGHEHLSHPFAIAQFGNYIYWTDWRTNSLLRANKWNGSNATVIQTTITQPFDLQVFHPRRQPDPSYENPCKENNGGCGKDALCLLTFEEDNTVSSRCLCPHLMKLTGNQKDCELDGNFLLYSKKQEIRGVDLKDANKNIIPALTVPNVFSPRAIDYDAKTHRLYWADGESNSRRSHHGIAWAYLNSTGIEIIIDTGTPHPNGFAIDWISRNMYFSSYSTEGGTISVAQLSGSFRTVLLKDGEQGIVLKKPSSLAIHPVKGQLYWSDLGPETNSTGSIWTSLLDGSNPSQLFPAEGSDIEIAGPTSLSIDYDANELWWVNSRGKTMKIIKCDLYGKNPNVFSPQVITTTVPTAITVNSGKIYVASSSVSPQPGSSISSSSANILVMSKANAKDYTVLRENTPEVTALKVFLSQRLKSNETNKCAENNGGCRQLCMPTGESSRVCRCTAGYNLAADGTSCTGLEAFLMFTNRTQIRGIPLESNDTTTKALAPISKISRASAIDFDAANDYIYWADHRAVSLSRIKRDLTDRKVITTGLSGVDGIAVDWVAGNIYWTDYGTKTIEVAQVDGTNRMVIVATNLTKPRAIAVDPHHGYLYWTDWGTQPRIERSRLDGSERQVLINTTIKNPYGLDIDYDNKALFWCDQNLNIIERFDIETSERTTILSGHPNLQDCMSLSVYGDFIYWTDFTVKDGSIVRARKDGSEVTVMRDHLGDGITSLKIFHKDKQKIIPDANPCQNNVRGCQELCFHVGDGRTQCACPHGKVVDEVKCENFETFIAFSRGSAIQTVHLFNDLNPNPPMPEILHKTHMRNVIGLAYDYANKRFFFTDIQRGDIQSVDFSGKNFTVIADNLGSAEGLVYDNLNKVLYWTSYTNSSISSIAMDVPDAKPHKLVRLSSEDHPRAIVIDPCVGKIFWTNWNDRAPAIQSADTSGQNVQYIITTNIRTPNGLAIDQKARKLYWSDARFNKLERCEYDGSNRVVFLSAAKDTLIPEHTFGLAVFGDYIYWTDWIYRAVISVNKYTGHDARYLVKNIMRQPMGIVAVSPDADNCTAHPCQHGRGGCSQDCNANEYGIAVCSCWDGWVLLSDNKTCTMRCEDGQFACKESGFCIKYDLICDDHPHCPNGADEDKQMCKTRSCPDTYFGCNNGQCIPESKRCDEVKDCKDASDEQNCVCRNDQFKCKSNGRCISSVYRCDSDKDCPDASDEIGCNATDCSHMLPEGADPSRMIHCNTTTLCILQSWLCDGQDDCGDNSDEQNCTGVTPVKAQCADDWFHCKESGECVPAHWKCDGEDDCLDKTDEYNCTYTCGSDKRTCDQTRCIPLQWVCDGRYDCIDRTDEPENCTHQSCAENSFSCNKSGNCIPKTWVCDGEQDCTNGEDEQRENGCDDVMCTDEQFKCHNWRCINKSFYCDRDDDCGDGSDELNCRYQKCSATQFQCRKTHQCISLTQRCDGVLDCSDHSDESNETCAAATEEPSLCGKPGLWRCNNGDCVNSSLLCNRRDDCGDFSDEIGCDINECERGACGKHKCTDLTIGYSCTCNSGFKKVNNTCVDIDECKDQLHCTHYCTNSYGSYRCLCADGYQLGNDKKSCKVIETDTVPAPILLISNRYYIRNISLTGQSVHLLAMNLTNAVALDFDWQEKQIYWSDVTSSASRIMRMSLAPSVNKTQKVEQTLHSTTLRNPDGIAVDWVGRNLYWCDKTTDTIEVSKLNGQYRKILVKKGIQEPRAIAVHPYQGMLFYSDWGDGAHIGRLGMDGSKPKKLIIVHVGWPNALTIDYVTSHIIWADARLDYIAMADLNGQNRHYIVQDNLPHIFAITVFADHIYWTDWEYKTVERAHKFTGQSRMNVSHFIHRPMDIQVFHPYRQRSFKKNQANPCDKPCGDGTLCLITLGGTDRVCACPEHHYHPPDNKSICLPNCTSSEFHCKNTYKCIPFWWKCDGQDDCGDGEDEPADCPKYHCRQTGLFQCSGATSQYHCISPTQICDGIPQCTNGSDEVNCDTHTCLETQFKCGGDKPKCIPASQKCNGNVDCDDRSDEKNCPKQTCAPHQFKCANNRCIPYVWRCDNDNDCGDNSDEPANCTSSECRPGYLKCKSSGRCVPKSWKCDGDSDCTDGSDEPTDECSAATCESTYFKCQNHRCIPGRWRCDYDNDCQDGEKGSDEMNCDARECSESEFRCENGRCIMMNLVCDGHAHCPNRTDEENCGDKDQTCKPEEDHFKCRDSGYCIPIGWRCDGELDCSDSSDETGCNNTCAADEYKCINSLCIPKVWQCDGAEDCHDTSDENIDICANFVCMAGYFRCQNHHCVPQEQVCDGMDQCGDNSDEANCGRKQCKKSEFQCVKTGQCLDLHYMCDNYMDCADGSDEGEICSRLESCKNSSDCHNDDMVCELHKNTGYCTCKPGYEYDPLLNMCTDKNDCLQFGVCSQICVDVRGGHKCECRPGFLYSNASGHHSGCTAAKVYPVILIGAENEIHASDVDYRGSYTREYPSQEESEQLRLQLRISSMALDMKNSLAYVGNHGIAATSILKFRIPEHLLRQNPTLSPRKRRDTDMKGDPARHTPTDNNKNNSPVLEHQGLEHLDIPDLLEPTAMAWDWVGNRLYWIDGEKRTISMMDPAEGTIKTVIKTNLEMPTSIAVDPVTRYIYWADRGRHAHIERAWLDGTHREIVINRDIYWPASLAIDYDSRRLYWADTKKRTVETVTLDERFNRTKVWVWPIHEEAPYRIDVFEDWLYMTTYRTHTVWKLYKYGKNDEKISHILARGLLHVADILVVHPLKQNESLLNDPHMNPCLTKPCGKSAMCIHAPNGSYVCTCPDGGVLLGQTDCDMTPSKEPCEGYCQHNSTCKRTEHGTIKCQCLDGYTGATCNMDLCHDRCRAGGTCVRGKSETVCKCPKGYEGPRCQTYKCAGHCKNGGFCRINYNGEPVCFCTYRYKGETCEISKSSDTCDAHSCKNDGSCSMDKDGRPLCRCKGGFTGASCEACNICTGSQCTNFTCTNGVCTYVDGSPRCECDLGYQLQCEVEGSDPNDDSCNKNCVNRCKGFCENGGTCEFGEDKKTPVCLCLPGYSGVKCEKDMCALNCKNGECKVEGKNISCVCNAGYSGPSCNVSVCPLDACKNGAECTTGTNTPGSPPFQCLCTFGYTGVRCEEERGCDIVKCYHGGVCTHEGTRYFCKCPPEWTGQTCGKKVPPECYLHCQNGGVCSDCTPAGGTHVCEQCDCPQAYGGRRCEKEIGAFGHGGDGSTIAAVVVPALLCILIVLVILGICIYRRRANRQFKHMRMTDSANVEISNPMYMRDYEDDEGGDVSESFTLDPDKPTNFSNPMYDTLYNENAAALVSPDGEKNQLLKEDSVKVRFYGDEERQPLDQPHA